MRTDPKRLPTTEPDPVNLLQAANGMAPVLCLSRGTWYQGLRKTTIWTRLLPNETPTMQARQTMALQRNRPQHKSGQVPPLLRSAITLLQSTPHHVSRRDSHKQTHPSRTQLLGFWPNASDRDNCLLSHWTPSRSPPIRGVRSSLSSQAHKPWQHRSLPSA